jgi:hypothetical protein
MGRGPTGRIIQWPELESDGLTMPKVSKYPRLRTKVYRGAAGQVYAYYTYDMRPEGKPDIRLGTDRDEALRRWDELHHHKPRTLGRLQEAINRWRERELPKYDNAETRRSYAKSLRNVEKVFGEMAWDEVTVPDLRMYLDLRKAKTQGNREMAVLSVVWSKAVMWGMTRLTWPAAGIKGWKNKEAPREFTVTDELFSALYAEGDQVLRDCMDIATATGMRLTDARTVLMPVDGVLRHKAGKTGKWMEFDVASSPVLSALVARREAMKAHSVMLLTTKRGRQVSSAMLWLRLDAARERAADKAAQTGNPGLAQEIRGMFLRDMRKRASELAEGLDEAAKLLQHDSKALTRKHYRQGPEKLRAVR